MPIIKVTALANITILDPYPMEGVGEVTIQQEPGEYKEYDVLHQQSERLIPLLDSARTAGYLTYTITGAGSGSLEILDEGTIIESSCSSINFVGDDVQANSDGSGNVTIFHPPLPFSPSLGISTGELQWPSTTPGIVSRPEGGEGFPYRTNGWADRVNTRARLNTTDINTFLTANGGLGITHTSLRVTNLHIGQIDISVSDGLGVSSTVSLLLNATGGDQDAISADTFSAIHIRNTTNIGPVVEGTVYIWVDIASILSKTSSGPGGYFKIEVNHTYAPTTADFGEAFWDAGVVPSGSINPTVAVDTAVPVVISGIRFFNSGSTFLVEDTPIIGVSNIVNQTIDFDEHLLLVDASDFNTSIGEVSYDSSSISGLNYGPSLSPLRTDTARYSQVITVGAGDFSNNDAMINTTWHNFYGDEAGSPKASVSGTYQILTSNGSTDTTEVYDRETYRLQDSDGNNFKLSLSDYRRWYGGGSGIDLRNWDSTQSIDTGTSGHTEGLQHFLGRLIYPVTDFSTGYYFSDFDYSVSTGDRTHIRAYDVGDLWNHKKFTITMEVQGLNVSDFDIGYGADDSTDVRLDVMFPGPERATPDGSNDSAYPGSGWLHCGKIYNGALFEGVDNDGVLETIDLIGDTLTITIVTENFSTEYTDGTLFLRIRFKDTVVGSIGQTTIVGV